MDSKSEFKRYSPEIIFNRHKAKFPSAIAADIRDLLSDLSSFAKPEKFDIALSLTTVGFWNKVEVTLKVLEGPNEDVEIMVDRQVALSRLLTTLVQGGSGLAECSKSSKAEAQSNIGKKIGAASEALKSDPFFEAITLEGVSKFNFELSQRHLALNELEGILYQFYRTVFDVEPGGECSVSYKPEMKERVAAIPGLFEVLSTYWRCETARRDSYWDSETTRRDSYCDSETTGSYGSSQRLHGLLAEIGLAAQQSSIALKDKNINPAVVATTSCLFQGKNSLRRWMDTEPLLGSEDNQPFPPLYGDFEPIHDDLNPRASKPQLNDSVNNLFAQRLIEWFYDYSRGGNLPSKEIGEVAGVSIKTISNIRGDLIEKK